MQRIFKNYNLLFFLSLLLPFSYYVFVGNFIINPDFGWHLRFGEIIIRTHSVPKLDLFSYTMPSYNFINHEWLFDLIIAILYPLFGQLILSLFFALFVIIALFIQAKNAFGKWIIFPLFVEGLSIGSFAGVRPQAISFLFFSILVTVIFNKKYLDRCLMLTPLFFLLWANIHGSFLLGLAVFGVAILAENIQNKKINKKEITVLIISVAATLVNPYGINLWKEIFITATDVNLRFLIQEWAPAIYFINLPFFTLSILSLLLSLKYFSKYNLTEKTLYFFLFFLALSSVRNIIYFVPLEFFITVKGLGFFYKDLSNYPFGQIRFDKLYVVLCALSIIFFVLKISWGFYVLPANTETELYPKKAVEFLRANPSGGQVFSTYSWGGYLIWKLPSKKVFVDGRMPSWENPSAPKNESKNAYQEYNQILNRKLPLMREVNKYKIDTFLIDSVNKQVNKSSNKFFQFLLSPILGNQYDANSFVSELSKNGFSLVYKDSVAEIYRKF